MSHKYPGYHVQRQTGGRGIALGRAQALLITQHLCAVHRSGQRMMGDVRVPTSEGLFSCDHQLFIVLNERVRVSHVRASFQAAHSLRRASSEGSYRSAEY